MKALNAMKPMIAVQRAALLALVALSAACATAPAVTPGPAPAAQLATNPVDPWEGLNRKIFAFNETVDEALLKPVATAYKTVVPEPIRAGVGNVFGNVFDVWSALNHLLQGKLQTSLEMGLRVGVNSFFGLGGVLDVASEMQLERRSEDFGQTLGVWGVPPGPFLTLPLLGPKTLRDAAAFPVDRLGGLSSQVSHNPTSYSLTALELVHTRAGLLSAGNLLGQVALDRYSFVRDAYLARRRNDVFDGNPPPEPEEPEPAAVPPPARKPM